MVKLAGAVNTVIDDPQIAERTKTMSVGTPFEPGDEVNAAAENRRVAPNTPVSAVVDEVVEYFNA